MVSIPSIYPFFENRFIIKFDETCGGKLEFNYFTWPTRYSRILSQYYTCYEMKNGQGKNEK